MTIHFSNDTFVRDRQKTELRIAARLLADIYAGPHHVEIDNGDDVVSCSSAERALDEMFEVVTLVQTKKVDQVPLIFVGSDYWKGLLEWIESTVLKKEKNIGAEDLKLFHITDDPAKVVKIINQHYKKKGLKPNYRL